MAQKAYSFDKVTLVKILKGAGFAALGAGSLFLLDAVGQLQIDSPFFASLVAFVVPTLANALREFIKGQ